MIVNLTSQASRVSGLAEAQSSKPPTSEPAQNVRETRSVGTGGSDLRAVVAVVEKRVASMQRSLAFAVDEQTGRTVVTVTDRDTGETIRQIPEEEALALFARLSEATAGILLAVET